MHLWSLSILVTATWLLWALGGFLGLHADKLVRKRREDARFSITPVIPLFPLFAIVVAYVGDKFVAPWGTWVVGAIHALLALMFLVCIGREIHRIRACPRP
jgi:hypothetical protein